MSLLWSLSVNCLVVIYQHTTRFYQVLTMTLVDNIGKSILNVSFIIAHLRCWGRVSQLLPCYQTTSSPDDVGSFRGCESLSLVTFIVFLAFFSTWLLMAMTPDELYSSGYSFLPIWAFARFTEVFYLGSMWAFLVQYGSSESARRKEQERQRRNKEREREKLRRARLMRDEVSWFNCVDYSTWFLCR